MVRLIHGEAIEEMRKLPSDSVDLVLCDPPYGVTRNEWDKPIPLSPMWGELKRICKGAICLFADGMFMAELMVSGKDLWKYNLVWDKVLTTGFLNANRQPLRRHEEICVFYENPPKYNPQMSNGEPNHSQGKRKEVKTNNNYGEFSVLGEDRITNEKYPSSIIRIPKVHPSVSVHPTEKPVELMEWLVKTYSNSGDTVLDFCMGSGTTGVASVSLGRKFIGIELSEEYFQIAEKRMSEIQLQWEG